MNSRIMIVEDELIISLDIKESLKVGGYKNIFSAESGETCLEMLKKDPFDLILMDIRLSGDINGIQAAHLIRSMYDIPVIYITSYSDVAVLDDLKKTEPYGYLTKPIDKNQLFSNIEIALYKHRTSRKLEEARQTMQAVLNASGDHISLVDHDGIILNSNNQFASFFGMSSQELAGTSIFDLYPPDKSQLKAQMTMLLNNSQPVTFEEQSGDRTFENRLYPVLSVRGKIASVAIYSRDITERIRLEQQKEISEGLMRESEVKYRNLYHAMSQGVLYHDSRGHIISANPAAENILGLSADQMYGTVPMDPRWSLTDENGNEIKGRQYPSMEALKTGKIIHDTILGVNVPGDNAFKWIKVSSIPDFTPSDHMAYQIITTFEDITDIQNIKNDIAFRLQFIQMLIDSIPTPVYYKDRDLKYIGCNRAFEEFSGLQKDLIIWRSSENIYHGDLAEIITGHEKTLMGNSIPVTYETSIRRDETVHTMVFNEALFYDLNGNVAGIIGVIMDITSQRNLEKELINAIDDERRRIGQDLHDSLGQKLTGLSFLLKALGFVLNDKKSRDIDHGPDIKIMTDLVSDLIYQTRQISRGLNPMDMEYPDLLSALQDLADETMKIFRVQCLVMHESDYFLIDRDVIVNIYYIVRESVNNAIKHGSPDRIVIRITDDGNYYRIDIINNSRDVKNGDPLPPGMGLKIMKYRAGIIGAEFNVQKGIHDFTVSVKIKKDRHRN